jgi:hypothetical protein
MNSKIAWAEALVRGSSSVAQNSNVLLFAMNAQSCQPSPEFVRELLGKNFLSPFQGSEFYNTIFPGLHPGLMIKSFQDYMTLNVLQGHNHQPRVEPWVSASFNIKSPERTKGSAELYIYSHHHNYNR